MENNPSANLTAKFSIEKQKDKKSKEEKAYEDTRNKAIAALTKSILSCRKKVEDGAFKNAFNSTGVSTCIVKLQN